MARALPRVTKEVLTLIGNAEAALQRGRLSYARTLANALYDAGFANAASDIENKVKAAEEAEGET